MTYRRLGAILVSVALAAGVAVAPVQRAEAINGGENVGAYPWAAALIHAPDGRSLADRFWCSGALIKPTLVLTAAHCVTDSNDVGRGDTVTIGRDALASNQGQKRTIVDIRRMDESDRWCPTRQQTICDVAIVVLNAPSTNADLDLADSAVLGEWGEGSTARVYGYGSARVGGPPTLDLRRAHVQITDLRPNHRTLFAAGSAGAPCKGDSGGPMTVSTSRGPRIVGVVRAFTDHGSLSCRLGEDISYTKAGWRGSTTNSPVFGWIAANT